MFRFKHGINKFKIKKIHIYIYFVIVNILKLNIVEKTKQRNLFS